MEVVASHSDENWINLAGWQVLCLEETGSTNQDAMELSYQKPGEFVVWSRHQTAGKGREDRQWYSHQDCSLTFSVVLRPDDEERQFLSRFTALGALALADLLKEACGLEAEIKWPNDVLISGKKISGILTETTWSGAAIDTLIMGVGVNLRDEAFEETASQLRFPATSLQAEGCRIDSSQEFLEKLLDFVCKRREQIGSTRLIDEWNERLAFKGEFRLIKQYQGKTEMLCPVSINPDGSLNVRDQSGHTRVIQSAEFSASRSASEPSSS